MDVDVEKAAIKVCRTCLELIDIYSTHFSLESLEPPALGDKLKNVLPEISLHLTPGAVVCSDCCAIINSLFQFKLRCLEIEGSIQNFCLSAGNFDCVDLISILQEPKQLSPEEVRIKLEIEIDLEEAKKELNTSLNETSKDGDNSQLEVESSSSPHLEDNSVHKECPKSDTEDPDGSTGLCKLEMVDIGSVEFNTDSLNVISQEHYDEDRVNQITEHLNEFNSIEPATITEHLNKFNSIESATITEYLNEFDSIESATNGDAWERPISKAGQLDRKRLQRKKKETSAIDTITPSIASHSRSNLFKCKICSFESTSNGSFKVHMMAHRGERPHKCHLCPYAATQKGNLRTHLITHTGEQPFNCLECGHAFKRRVALKMHLKMQHSIGNKRLQQRVKGKKPAKKKK